MYASCILVCPLIRLALVRPRARARICPSCQVLYVVGSVFTCCISAPALRLRYIIPRDPRDAVCWPVNQNQGEGRSCAYCDRAYAMSAIWRAVKESKLCEAPICDLASVQRTIWLRLACMCALHVVPNGAPELARRPQECDVFIYSFRLTACADLAAAAEPVPVHRKTIFATLRFQSSDPAITLEASRCVFALSQLTAAGRVL